MAGKAGAADMIRLALLVVLACLLAVLAGGLMIERTARDISGALVKCGW